MSAEEREVFDLLVLAAIERAGEENEGPSEGREGYGGPAGSARVSSIVEHAGGPRAWRFERSGYPTEREVRPACKRLVREELAVEYRPKYSSIHYGLTPAGDERLAQLAEDGAPVELPESPARRRWREWREEAAAELDGLRERVREAWRRCEPMADAGKASELEGFAEGLHGPYLSEYATAADDLADAVRELRRALLALEQDEPE